VCLCVSWVAYEGAQFTRDMYVLEEGDYPNAVAIGFLSSDAIIRSIQIVRQVSICPRANMKTSGLVHGKPAKVMTFVNGDFQPWKSPGGKKIPKVMEHTRSANFSHCTSERTLTEKT